MITEILTHLSKDYPWKDQLHCFPTVSSTNDYLKELARSGAPHGTAVIAAHQSAGRGRMGRSFQSPEGKGVYLSFLLRPDCPAAELMHLTCAVAVAMCDAVEKAVGFRPGIKWTNDLVYGRKKLGGILTELSLGSKGTVDFAIVGIGINCCHAQEDFSAELRPIAASISMITGQQLPPAALAASMLDALRNMDAELLSNKENTMYAYRKDCITIGQDISLVRGDEVRHGKALDVDPEGALIVAFPDGSVQSVNSGEVSVRGMYGYV